MTSAIQVKEALANCLGCIEAAETEGLHELIVELRGSNETVDRLIDLIDRRLLWVREYAVPALATPIPAALDPVTVEAIARDPSHAGCRCSSCLELDIEGLRSMINIMKATLEELANLKPALLPDQLVDRFIEVRVKAKVALARALIGQES